MRRLFDRHRRPKAEALNEDSPERLSQFSEREKSNVLSSETSSILPVQCEDLWDRAYKLLQEDKDSRKVIETYEKVLASLLKDEDVSSTAPITGADKQKQLAELVAKRLKVVEDARWKFDISDQTVEVKAQIDRIVKTVLFAKDLISSAVSAEPHAALAWTGVCVLLPLLLNPTAQQQDLIRGLDLISDVICRYRVIESTHREQKAKTLTSQSPSIPLDKASESLETQITKLYSEVLRYQAQVVCQLLRPAVMQYARDVFKVDNWAVLLAGISDTDSACQRLTSVIDPTRLADGVREQTWKMDNLQNTLRIELIKINQANDELAKDIHNDRMERQNRHQTAEESKCLQALYKSDYKAQKARNPDRVPGTCQWLLRNATFQSWLENKSSDLLWVTADPGCGKSVLSKSLIDNELRSTPSSVTAYFFFKDDNNDQRQVTRAICALLHQILLQSDPELRQKVVKVFESHSAQLAESFPILWDLLLEVSKEPKAGQIVCILDALDECEESGQKLLINSLNALYNTSGQPASRANGSNLKFLVTSRPYQIIQYRFDSQTIRLAGEDESELIKQEIDLVIRHRVPQVTRQLSLDTRTQESLQQRLLDADNRTYLWLHLILEDILERGIRVKTAKRMERFLNELPNSIYEAYDHMLKRSTEPETAKKLLHIILAAYRPLTIREMNMALNIEEGQTSREEVDLDPEDDVATHIRDICGLFVFVSKADPPKIYLIHQTAKEFLLSREPILQGADPLSPSSGTWKHSMTSESSNYVLTRICFDYLLLPTFETGPLRDKTDEVSVGPDFRTITYKEEDYDFLDYAAKYWAFHFRHARMDSALLTGWGRICDTGTQRFNTWFRIHWQFVSNSYAYSRESYDPNPPTLVLASMLGHPVIVEQLAKQQELEQRDSYGRTALWWAAMNRHVPVVRQLLEKGVFVGAKSDVGGTPTLQDVLHEYSEIIHPLIKYGALVNNADGKKRTRHLDGKRRPIEESKPILDLLISYGANVDRRTERPNSPIFRMLERHASPFIQRAFENARLIARWCAHSLWKGRP